MNSQELFSEPEDIIDELDEYFNDKKDEILSFLKELKSGSYESSRYRDHFIHMFNVYIFGCRILSLILNKYETTKQLDVIRKYFKIEPERDIPFSKPYTAKERLFFLWKIISIYHDVGIPIQHINNIKEGLDIYLHFFGYKLSNYYLVRDESIRSKLNYYLKLITSFFPSGIHTKNSVYINRDKSDPYLSGILLKKYDEMDHGVMSALGLLHSFENIFLTEDNEIEAYNLSIEQYKQLTDRLLEQDIARAAFCHCIHSISEKEAPNIFPISFDKYPLLFLLVLCDELQEFFRLEGITLSGTSCLTKFPSIKVFCDSKGHININITICYMEPNKDDINLILKSAQSWAYSKKSAIPKNYKEVLVKKWTEITNNLQGKLCLGKTETLSIYVQIYIQETGRTILLESWDSDAI
jgi:hypothetical protein